MGLFKDLRKLKKQAKALSEQASEQSGVDASLGGLLRQAPNMMNQATEALSLVQEGQAERDRLNQIGVRAAARLVSVRETGMTVGGSGLGAARENPVADLDLEVSLPDDEPYPVTVRQMVPRLAVARLVPGSQLPVIVDPGDRQKLLIDWEAPI